MWKYRSEIIFLLGILFACKASFCSDWASVVTSLALFGMHSADRFFTADRVDVKISARLKSCEENLAIVTTYVGQLKAGNSIKNGLLSGRTDVR